jgi:DNA polymerase-3 subunit alpha
MIQSSPYQETLNFFGVRIPSVPDYGDSSPKDIITQLCFSKLDSLGISSTIYSDRVNYEISVLERLGFTNYLLMVHHMLSWCDKNSVPYGVGRGSVAGSMVAYLLGITKADPIKYRLLFERFLNEARTKQKVVDGIKYSDGGSVPDIDTDFSYIHRKRFLTDYLYSVYAGRTCKIQTFNSMTSRLCLKEVGKAVAECTDEEMNFVTKAVEVVFGQPRSIKSLLDGDGDNPPNPAVCGWASKHKEASWISLKLENLIKNYGVHASGYIVSYESLDECMPYKMVDGEYVSAYDMEGALQSAIKLDILGIRTLDIINETAIDIREKLDCEFSVDNIDFESSEIYDFLRNTDHTYGLFQVGSGLGRKTMRDVSPKNLNQLSDVLALGRPGAMAFIPKYVKYARNGVFETLHPLLDPYLMDTAGIVLYQEQLMEIAVKVFGCTMSEANDLRKCVGKKLVDEIGKFEAKFVDYASSNGIPLEAVEIFWKIVKASASYSFNRSHSVSYAILTAQTAYLKSKYPLFFFKNALRMAKHEAKPHDKYAQIIKELPHFGIKILPPSLSTNNLDFEVEGNNAIRIGLSSLRGISTANFEKLKEYQDGQSNKFKVFEAISEAGIPVSVLESLIKAGCFSDFESNRSLLCLEARVWGLLTSRERSMAILLGESHSFRLLDILLSAKDGLIAPDGKPFMKTAGRSRWDTFYKAYLPYKDKYMKEKCSQSLTNYFAEVDVCGFSYSESLKDIYGKEYSDISNISDALEDSGGKSRIIFRVKSFEMKKSSNGKDYCRMVISDESGECDALIFSDAIRQIEEQNSGFLATGDIAIALVSSKDELFFMDSSRVLYRS